MEQYLIKGETLTAIADKIREKSSIEPTYVIQDEFIKSGNELADNCLKIAYIEYIDMGEEYSEPLMEENDDAFIDGDKYMWYDYWENNEGEVVPVLFKTDIYGDEPDDPDYNDPHYYVGTEEIYGDVYDKWRKIDDNLTWEISSQKYILTNQIVKLDQVKYSPPGMSEEINNLLNSYEGFSGYLDEFITEKDLEPGDYIELINSFGAGIVNGASGLRAIHVAKIDDDRAIIIYNANGAVYARIVLFTKDGIQFGNANYLNSSGATIPKVKAVPLRENLIAVLVEGNSTGPILRTITIASDGMTLIGGSSIMISGAVGGILDIIKLSRDKLVVTYMNNDGGGVINTIVFKESGSASVKNGLIFADDPYAISMKRINDSHILVGYMDGSGVGEVILFNIASSGTVSSKKTLTISNCHTLWCYLEKVTDNKYIFFYNSSSQSATCAKLIYLYNITASSPTMSFGANTLGIKNPSTSSHMLTTRGYAVQLENNYLLLVSEYSDRTICNTIVQCDGSTCTFYQLIPVAIQNVPPDGCGTANLGTNGLLSLWIENNQLKYLGSRFASNPFTMNRFTSGGMVIRNDTSFTEGMSLSRAAIGEAAKILYVPKTFLFNVSYTIYSAQEHMTWYDWCQSYYNNQTTKFVCFNPNAPVMTSDYAYVVTDPETGMNVYGSSYVREAEYIRKPAEISFDYSTAGLTAKTDMTWYDWINNSGYDQDGIGFTCASTSAQVYASSGAYKVGLNGDYVYGRDKIKANEYYDRTEGSSRTFTIKYNANGGSGTMSNTTVTKVGGSTEKRDITYKNSSFTPPSGKIFVGWCTNANGTGTKYKPTGSISMAPGTVTLYAQYVQPVKLTYYKTNDISFIATWLGSNAKTGPMDCLSATLTIPSSYSAYYDSATIDLDFSQMRFGENGGSETQSISNTISNLPKGTTLKVNLKNKYYNAKLNHCSALLNGVEKTYGTDISYTYTLNSNATANFKWRVEGLFGGQTALTCDSWWDCYLTM